MKSCLTSSEISKYDDIILSKSVKNDKNILFPKDFILGASTSSYQVEGCNDKCNWSIFENKQEFSKNIGTGSWLYFEQEVELMKYLGINSYRMSLEWARIVPEPYTINDKVLEKYHQQIKLFLQGIQQNIAQYANGLVGQLII